MNSNPRKSPFPGMDPFIEVAGLWEDFHQVLIGEIRSALRSLLPDRYTVRTQERGYISVVEEDEKKESPFVGDVGLTSVENLPRAATEAAPAGTETLAGTEPVSLRPFVAEEFREAFLEIYLHQPERHLVTCIEVLSPSNKRPGKGRKLYKRKRQAMLLGETNFVEVDLLRGGERMPMLDPWPNSPYTVLVSRSLAPRCKVWPVYSTRPLPALQIPLAGSDPPVAVELQPLIDSTYASSNYARDIDYARQPPFPLTAEEQRILKEIAT